MTNHNLFHKINTVPKLILVCIGVFAVSFLLSVIAIWWLPGGEVVGNVLRALAAVLNALLILGFINSRTSKRK